MNGLCQLMRNAKNNIIRKLDVKTEDIKWPNHKVKCEPNLIFSYSSIFGGADKVGGQLCLHCGFICSIVTQRRHWVILCCFKIVCSSNEI